MISTRMKVYIHYKIIDQAHGGGNQFLRAFRTYSQSKDDIQIVDSINKDYEIFLMNGGYKGPSMPLNIKEAKNVSKYGKNNIFYLILGNKLISQNEIIYKLIEKFGYFPLNDRLLFFLGKRNKKIVYRLDGFRGWIYHYKIDIENETDLPKDKYPMDNIQVECMKLADHIVFQSKQALKNAKVWGFKGKEFSIIHNGVDQRIFYPDESKFWNQNEKLKVFACSWSDNRLKGFKEIAEFSKLKGVIVNFVGRWPREINSQNVNVFPVVKQEKLAAIYRGHHIYLFPSRNETCPNTVLEALSSGLPVIYHHSGGTPEIIRECGVKIDTQNLEYSLAEIKERYEELINNIFKNMNYFSIERALKEYISVFKKVLADA